MRRSLRNVIAIASLLGTCSIAAHVDAADAKVESEAKKLAGDAMDVDFLSLDLKAAQSKLEKALKKCGDSKCAGATVAMLHVDLGVVLINAKDGRGGAAQFEAAFAADTSVTIAKDYLADPKVKAAWEAAKAKAASGGDATPAAGGGDDGAGDDAPPPKKSGKSGGDDAAAAAESGSMSIEFKKSPIGYAYPIIVKVADGMDVQVVKVSYKTATMEKFKAIEAKKDGDVYIATLGCEDTQFVGQVKVYVRAYDGDKNEVDHLSTIKKPLLLDLVEKMGDGEEAPSYPGGKEVDKCVDKSDCQPGFPCDQDSKKPQGSGCDADDECQKGLSCVPNDNGSKWCYDAGGGDSSSGDSAVGDDSGEKKSQLRRKLWVGIDLEQDFLGIGSQNDICNQSTWACTQGGYDVGVGAGQGEQLLSGQGGNSAGGFAFGTTRILASLDYFVADSISLGVRLGYAFGGNPTNTSKFTPEHVEARLQYFFASPVRTDGFKPFLLFAGGLAEFDASISSVTVRPAPDGNGYTAPITPDPGSCNPGPADCTVSGVKAYRLAGKAFVETGIGFWYVFSSHAAFDAALKLIAPLPTFSFGVGPEIGLKFGF